MSVVNRSAFFETFGKQDNVARYTQRSKISYLNFLFHLNLLPIFLEFSIAWTSNSRIVPESFPETFHTTWPNFESTEFSVRHVVNLNAISFAFEIQKLVHRGGSILDKMGNVPFHTNAPSMP